MFNQDDGDEDSRFNLTVHRMLKYSDGEENNSCITGWLKKDIYIAKLTNSSNFARVFKRKLYIGLVTIYMH
ncbi:CLUMA_CG011644, isoform A [Clunio marinus]|uniref:CLUMA_CG011644, isoform A n=1 Tax=Clunio marinus TaxID=568069 RepID=A0A1J1IEU2_9DIPT|nr:CLUMA_CG011644, isoform A [Clunio marinus]